MPVAGYRIVIECPIIGRVIFIGYSDPPTMDTVRERVTRFNGVRPDRIDLSNPRTTVEVDVQCYDGQPWKWYSVLKPAEVPVPDEPKRELTDDQSKWLDDNVQPDPDNWTVRVVIDERKPGGCRYCFTNFCESVTLAGVREYISTNDRLKVIDIDHPQTKIVVETRQWIDGRNYDRVDRKYKDGYQTPWKTYTVLKSRKTEKGASPYPTGSGNVFIPDWNASAPPKAPNPLPGTKRYVMLLKGEMTGESDDRDELMPLMGAGGDTLCDRHMPRRVNKYSKMTPVNLFDQLIPLTDGVGGPVIGKAENVHTDESGNVVADLFIEAGNTPEPPKYRQVEDECRRIGADPFMPPDGTSGTWTSPENPNPNVTGDMNEAMRAIENASRTPKEVFWSPAMQRDGLVRAMFEEYKLSKHGTFEDFLMALCVELWKAKNKQG